MQKSQESQSQPKSDVEVFWKACCDKVGVIRKDLNFDLYAMVNPQNSRDQVAMLKEAISELVNINSKLDALLMPSCDKVGVKILGRTYTQCNKCR